MTGCKSVLLARVCEAACERPQCRSSSCENIFPPPSNNFVGCGMRERRAATRLVAGPEPPSSGTERAREQGLMVRVHSISEKNFWRKISKFLVGEEAFSDPTSIIIRRL